MSRIVLATLDAGGNVPPVLGIGDSLVRQGHEVYVIGHPAQRSTVEAAGLPFTSYARARAWSPTTDKSTLRGLLELVAVFNDRGIGRDVVALARDTEADVVAIDCMLLGALAAAHEADIRCVSLFHTFHAYFDGPWRRGPVGLLSALRGHRARQLWQGCARSLTLSLRALDPTPTDAGNTRLTWSGPVVQGTSASPPTRPRVLVSLSTTAFPGMAQTLQRIVDALGTMEVDVVVTTGPSIDPGSVRAADNTIVERYVDHAELMPRCSAVVGHGGHATTLRTLAHDLPLLVIPAHTMLDQKMVGEAVAHAGAGLVLPRKATREDIRNAVQDLLGDPTYRTSAASLGRQIRAARGADTAAEQIVAAANATAT